MSTTTISYPETTSGLVLSAGDQEIVSSGGIAYATVINEGGNEYVSSGGAASGTIVNWNGYQFVSGSAVKTTIDGGFQSVISSGQAIGTTVSNGLQTVVGSATDTTVDAGGMQTIYGTATSTVVNSGGAVLIGNAATATDLTVHSGGFVVSLPISTVISGLVIGLTNSTTVMDTNIFEAGAIIQSAVVLSGGSTIGAVIKGHSEYAEYVSSGGFAGSTVISGGGVLEIGSGGSASGTIGAASDDGIEGVDAYLSSGGAATSPYFDPNSFLERSVGGGTTIARTIAGAYEVIGSGGSETDATFYSGGYQEVYGTATRSTIIGGSQNVYGGTAISTTLIGSLQYVSAGSAIGTLVDSGSYQYVSGTAINTEVGSGSLQYVFNGGTATSTTVNSGGLALIGSGGTATAFIISSGGMEEVASGANVSGTMLLSGGSIYVDYLAYQSNATVYYDQSTHILTLTEDGTSYSQVLSSDYTSDEFKLSAYSSGTLITEVPCYCRNTRIATDRGEIAVEDLEIGDHVINHKGEARSIKWIGKRAYAGRFIQGRKDILPICFEAGSIAENVPRRDLWVSPHHAMYLNGVFIEARDLVNDISIYQADYAEEVEYFHVELDSHDAIIAEGALSESFFNHSDRGVFHNARDYFVLYQNDEKVLEPRYYAPRVDAGETVEAARAVLDARAKTLFRRSFIG